jgi:fluoroquinolone transport system ATP-binding protein
MIDVQDLHFSYPGNTGETLKGLSFNLGKGEIFGFLGPSGAGKSTTQKILIGILKRYQGTVQVMNREIKQARSDYYEKIGVAFEFPNFYSKLTALENLNYFRSFYTSETETPEDLIALVGLEQDLHTKVSGFSKGMKIRLNFCRAFLNKPEIVFLDEPTSGLDPVNAKNIRNIILEKKQAGKTIFLTTHNMNVADELCDRVAFIVDGKIVLIDSPRNLKLRKGKKTVCVEYQENGAVKRTEFNLDGIGNNQKFLDTLRNHQIETIHTQEASLEDIFIEVTGRNLNENS